MAVSPEKINTEKTIRNVYIVAFILLFAAYLITLYSKKQLEKQAARVELTSIIIKTLDDLMIKVMDGETGVRGYIMNKNIQFLFPYYGSRETTDSLYNVLRGLTAKDPVQNERAVQLKKDIDRRFEQFSFYLKSFNDNNREMTDSMQKMQMDTKKTMDSIRSKIAIMEMYETRELAAWKGRMKETFKSINAFTIVSPVLAFFLALLTLI